MLHLPEHVDADFDLVPASKPSAGPRYNYRRAVLGERSRRRSEFFPGVEVRKQGRLCEVSYRRSPDKEFKPESLEDVKRGRIYGFSSHSRFRLMKFWNIVSDEDLKREKLFLTLTYGQNWPDGLKCKEHLEALRKRLDRAFAAWLDLPADVRSCRLAALVPWRKQWVAWRKGKADDPGPCPVDVVASPGWWAAWRQEPQERGAPHLHLVVIGASWVAPDWITKAWAGVIDQDGTKRYWNWPLVPSDDWYDPRPPYVHASTVNSVKDLMGYVCKYMSKVVRAEDRRFVVADCGYFPAGAPEAGQGSRPEAVDPDGSGAPDGAFPPKLVNGTNSAAFPLTFAEYLAKDYRESLLDAIDEDYRLRILKAEDDPDTIQALENERETKKSGVLPALPDELSTLDYCLNGGRQWGVVCRRNVRYAPVSVVSAASSVDVGEEVADLDVKAMAAFFCRVRRAWLKLLKTRTKRGKSVRRLRPFDPLGNDRVNMLGVSDGLHQIILSLSGFVDLDPGGQYQTIRHVYTGG